MLTNKQLDILRVIGNDAADEIEQLRSLLLACRGSVKTDLNTYERIGLDRKKSMELRTVTNEAVDDEAQRLFELLEKIDALAQKTPNATNSPAAKQSGAMKG